MLVVSFASFDFVADQTCCPRWSPHLRTTWWWCGGENWMRYISSFVFIVAPWQESVRINMIGSRDHRSALPWQQRFCFKDCQRTYSGWDRSSYVWKFVDCSPGESDSVYSGYFSSRSAVYQVAQHFLFTNFSTHRGGPDFAPRVCISANCGFYLDPGSLETWLSVALPTRRKSECEGKWTLGGFRFDPSIFSVGYVLVLRSPRKTCIMMLEGSRLSDYIVVLLNTGIYKDQSHLGISLL